MPDLNETYQALHDKQIAAAVKRVRKLYETSIQEIVTSASGLRYKNQPFSLSDFPALKKKVDAVTAKMHASIYALTVNGIENSWALANTKNDVLVNKRTAGRKVSKKTKQLLFDTNKGALGQFISRKEKGLNLSQRIWKTLEPFKSEMEQSLGLSIGQGESAVSMTKKIKEHLNEPDKLFRRVRSAEGKLVLSPAARAYHPGQGVYRSSYKNALRVTRTENNLAYRYSDYERWQNLPFVTGFEVKLSKMHPKYDICDRLAGKYPKTFKFGGWHPQCLCYMIPTLNSDKDFEKMEDAILAGEPIPIAEGRIQSTPAGFKDWLKENDKRVKGWSNKPYWMRDNEDWTRDAMFGRSFQTTQQVRRNIDFAKKNKFDTFDLYRDREGNLLPEREQLHQDIIDSIISNGSTKEGKVHMLGGAPANGKSTLIDSGQLKHPKGILKIDPDEIKGKLPEYNALVNAGDKKAAAFAHEESSLIGKQITDRALAQNMDLLSDGVGDGSYESVAKKVKKFKDAGKKTRADYVTLDTDLSLKLAEARAIKTGREVPVKYILDMNREIANLVPKFIDNKLFDELYLWDTNIAGKPRLILSQVNGKLKIANSTLYKKFLEKRFYEAK